MVKYNLFFSFHKIFIIINNTTLFVCLFICFIEADKGSNDLMKVTLDHIDPDVCKKYLEGDTGGKLMPQGLVSSIFCAGVLEGGKDTCQVCCRIL